MSGCRRDEAFLSFHTLPESMIGDSPASRERVVCERGRVGLPLINPRMKSELENGCRGWSGSWQREPPDPGPPLGGTIALRMGSRPTRAAAALRQGSCTPQSLLAYGCWNILLPSFHSSSPEP